jgi:hypothetical protein
VWVWSSIAMMEDGIFGTKVKHIFRVHSSSGDVEYRLVDVASCLCSCPNNGLMCSHRYAVITAKPKYATRFATIILVRRSLVVFRMAVKFRCVWKTDEQLAFCRHGRRSGSGCNLPLQSK